MDERMTPDNEPVFNTPLIEQVYQGMKVVDATGEEVGEVEYVQMGDPGTVTTAGNEYQEPGFIRGVARSIFGDEPDVPEPLRSQLLRSGFIKVDGPGLLDHDRYVRGDQIRSVADDTVTLAINKARMIEER